MAAEIQIYESSQVGGVFAVLVFGGPAGASITPIVRIHSGCVTGDIFRSLRCECGEQLEFAIEQICQKGAGVVIYIPWHEGRGIGLLHKIQAYALQDQGADTVEANHLLGFSADDRSYYEAADILLQLGMESVLLLSNNPVKFTHLAERGIKAERMAMPTFSNTHNMRYLSAKRRKLGHMHDEGE